MNNIQIFKNNEFGEVRTLVVEGEPWFVGKDVAESLGYAKARNAIATHVDGEDKKDAPIQGTLGGVQEMTIINESSVSNDGLLLRFFRQSERQEVTRSLQQ